MGYESDHEWNGTAAKPKRGAPSAGATLLACPFCGDPPDIFQPSAPPEIWRVVCRNRNCPCNPSTQAIGKQFTISLWNTRQANEKGQR